MFSCYVHSWYSKDSECPKCVGHETSATTDSNEVNFGFGKPQHIKNLPTQGPTHEETLANTIHLKLEHDTALVRIAELEAREKQVIETFGDMMPRANYETVRDALQSQLSELRAELEKRDTQDKVRDKCDAAEFAGLRAEIKELRAENERLSSNLSDSQNDYAKIFDRLQDYKSLAAEMASALDTIIVDMDASDRGPDLWIRILKEATQALTRYKELVGE